MDEATADDIPTQRDAEVWGGAGVPEILGNYRLAEVVGWGGMGAVYAAVDQRSGERVAIKVMRTDMGVDEQDRRRFRQELAIVQELHHPGIVAVREVGSHGPLEYLVMDLIVGDTLADRLAAGEVMPWERAVDLMIAVADAVAAAHAQGFVHRDLKPGNVLLDRDGRPYVADFGVARSVGLTSSLTASGTAVGTPEYMSPEQTRGRHKECTAASDVWSLGTLLYQLLTGGSPFRGESALDSMRLVNEFDPPTPRRIRTDLPAGLDRIVMQCLSKAPGRRYADAAALAADLRRLRQGERVSARSYSRFTRWIRRLPTAWSLLAATALALAIGGVVGWQAWQRARAGTWVTVAQWDFTTRAPDLDGLRFADRRLAREQPPWEIDAGGMVMPDAEWLWLEDIQLPADARIDLEIQWGAEPDGLELCLNSRPEALQHAGSMPIGYSCQVGGWNGLIDFISRNESHQGRHTAGSRHAQTEPHTRMAIGFYRRGDRLVLEVEGREPITQRYPLPLAGEGLDGIGLKVFTHDTRIRSMRVSRWVAGSVTTPLDRGDALAAAGAWAAAADEYRAIAEVHREAAIAAPALARAVLALHEVPGREDQREALRARLAADHPDSEYHRLVMEAEVMERWTAGRIDAAFAVFDAIVARFGTSDALLRALELKREVLDPDQAYSLLERIAHDRELQVLDLHDLGIDDLGPLAGLPLVWLNLQDNPVASLAPLRGAPLVYLTIHRTAVSDLRPLAGAPLQSLGMHQVPVTRLEGLEDSPLETLWASRTGLEELDALERCPRLVGLDISRTAVRDLTALRGTALERLYAAESAIDDLSPLADLPLAEVWIDGTAVRDLAPVAGPALRQLGAGGLELGSIAALRGAKGLEVCRLSRTPLTDLSPLVHPTLQRLEIVDVGIDDLAPLAGLGLQDLDCHRNPVTSLGWLLDAPPPLMRVPPIEHLDAVELERGLRAWAETRPELAMYCAARLARIGGDASVVHEHALPIAGGRIAVLGEDLARDEALALATAWGGHLPAPREADELQVIDALISDEDRVWTALDVGADGRARLAGELVPELTTRRYEVEAGTPLVFDGRHGLKPIEAGGPVWPAIVLPAARDE